MDMEYYAGQPLLPQELFIRIKDVMDNAKDRLVRIDQDRQKTEKEFNQEVTLYQKALKLYPKDVDAYYELCRLYQIHEKYQESREACIRAIEIFDGYAEAHHAQGFNEALLKNYQQAKIQFEKAKELYQLQEDSQGAAEIDQILQSK